MVKLPLVSRLNVKVRQTRKNTLFLRLTRLAAASDEEVQRDVSIMPYKIGADNGDAWFDVKGQKNGAAAGFAEVLKKMKNG